MGRTAVRVLLCAALAGIAGPAAAQEATESILKVPVKFQDPYRKTIEREITVTVVEVPGKPAYPLLVLSHGRSPDAAARANYGRARFTEISRYFASQGYSVWMPTRVGYGVSGADEDPEHSGNTCINRFYEAAFNSGVEQTLQVIEFARRRADIDARRLVLLGWSVGGGVTLGTAARNPPGLLAAINFAGGNGGDPVKRPGEPCEPSSLLALFKLYGKTTRAPALWVYAENDLYFAPKHARAWFEGFREAGGRGEIHMLPPFGKDGHALFLRGMEHWQPLVERFLAAAKL